MALGLLFRGVGFWAQGQRWESVAVVVTAAVVPDGVPRLRKYWWTRTGLSPKQVIAVTGCDSGLGYSLAMHCRDKGATVIAGVLQENGPAVLELLRSGISVKHLDVTDNRSVQNFAEAIGKILEDDQLEFRALVNNAGVMIFGEFEWQLQEQVKLQVEVNVLGTISVTKQLMPTIRRHSSRIVNVTSHCALAPLPGLSIYGATKAALEAWSTSLRVEVNKYGVSVVSFVPGSFIKESSILTHQKKYFDDMHEAMSEDTRRFYGDYFEKYVEYLTSVTVSTESKLRRIDNPKLYKAFDGALLDKRPSAFYKCEPWRYTFYHTLFRVMPTYARDWLVQRFMQMPKWTSRNRSSPVHQDDNAKGNPRCK